MSVGIEVKTSSSIVRSSSRTTSGMSTSSNKDRGKKHITRTADLPLPKDNPDAETIWTTVVVPRYLSYIASLDNPWDADSKGEEVNVLQRFWLEAFGEHLKGEDDVRKVCHIVSDSFRIWYTIEFRLPLTISFHRRLPGQPARC